MKIELVPPSESGDPAASAAVAAIERTGLADDVGSAASVSAWRRAGILEAVDRSTTPRDAAQPNAGPNVRAR